MKQRQKRSLWVLRFTAISRTALGPPTQWATDRIRGSLPRIPSEHSACRRSDGKVSGVWQNTKTCVMIRANMDVATQRLRLPERCRHAGRRYISGIMPTGSRGD
jgi:hypothetical protein